jgi:fibronectin-binding autotransporter adhesin
MRIHTIRALMLLLAVISPALATPVIDAGTHYMLPNDVHRIAITVSGGDSVQGVDLYVQVADGGAINSGTATMPKITAVDIIGSGTLFSQSNKGAQPAHLPDSGGTYLIWTDSTTTQTGVSLNASGTLAYLTVDTTGTHTTDSAYALSLTGVAANYFGLGGYDTNFGDYVSSTINNGYIVISNVRDLTWNASANGAWTATTWAGALPAYPTCPNYTSNAIVNTPYTVSVSSSQEANSLAISGGGKVSIGAASSLAITAGLTVSSGGTLSLASTSGLSASGIQLSGGTISGSGTLSPLVALSGGTLDTPTSGDNLILSLASGGTGGLSKTGSGTATILTNATYAGDTAISAGCLQFDGASSTLHSVTGNGTLALGNGVTSSTATADSVQVGVLTLGAGSTLTINAIPGGPSSAGSAIAAVPEPSVLVLLAVAAVIMLYRKRK